MSRRSGLSVSRRRNKLSILAFILSRVWKSAWRHFETFEGAGFGEKFLKLKFHVALHDSRAAQRGILCNNSAFVIGRRKITGKP